MTSQERLLLSQFNHPNIINYNEFHLENDKAYIIMEYGEEGVIQKIFRTKTIKRVIKFIHGKNIIHRNLEQNSLLT